MRTLAFAVTVLLLAAAAPAAAQTAADTTPTIVADGIGTATLVPDLADFEVAVLRRAPTSSAARSAANRRIAAILRAVKAHGVADADIQTTALELTRERVGRRGHRRVRYTAAQSLRVRARDVKTLGALVDAVANAGADQIGSPSFGFADASAGRLLATRAALVDARRRADDAAAQSGLRITGVRTVDLDPQTEPVGPAAAGGGSNDAAKAPTRVEPGTQDFDARVRVTYTAAAL
jgi:uncharacterized protein YggE